MKALICGAGIAGLTLACRLHQHGWQVTVVDHAPGPRQQGYMIDFSGPGFEAITAMGLRRRLLELASGVEEFRYVDTTGRIRVRLDYSRFVTALDGEIVSIMRPALEQLLREALDDTVQVRYGVTVEEVVEQKHTTAALLSDGSREHADLVVGADGIHSRIRALAFGPEEQFLRHLGMHTAAFVFSDQDLFEEVRGRFVLTETLDRQLGVYGLEDGRVAAFAVHRSTDDLPADPRQVLRYRMTGMGELVERALAQCPPPEQLYYDQVAQILMPRWTAGGTALVGDAAYAVSLVAGQGASLGIAGAYVLAEMLAPGGPVPEALAEYERRWRPVATGIQHSARDRVIEWFLPTSYIRLLVRRWGFRAMRLPGLSRLMVGALFPKDRRTITELSDTTTVPFEFSQPVQ